MYEKDNHNTINIFNNHSIIYGSCYARAGGGSGSGSSGGGSSSSRGNSYHDHYYGRRGRSNPIEGIVMTVVVVSGIYGLNASQRRRKARLLHQKLKTIDILDDVDAFGMKRE